MAGFGRCWLCGRALADGAGSRICASCMARALGLCASCDGREACSSRYQATLAARQREGLRAPEYPPCTMRAPAMPPGWLIRAQNRVYGEPLAGMAALVLADSNADAEASLRGDRAIHGALARLRDQWGAVWAVPCDCCGRTVHLSPGQQAEVALCSRCTGGKERAA